MMPENKPSFSRRDFLKGLGAFSAALIFSACKAEEILPTGTTEPDPTKPSTPEVDPTVIKPTATKEATATATETAKPSPTPRAEVIEGESNEVISFENGELKAGGAYSKELLEVIEQSYKQFDEWISKAEEEGVFLREAISLDPNNPTLDKPLVLKFFPDEETKTAPFFVEVGLDIANSYPKGYVFAPAVEEQFGSVLTFDLTEADGGWKYNPVKKRLEGYKKIEYQEELALFKYHEYEQGKSVGAGWVEEIKTENLSQIPLEKSQFIHPELSYHMSVNPEKAGEAYDLMLEAIAKCPMLEKYWRDWGINQPDKEKIREWLKKSIGGPENKAYWLPQRSPNGIEFGYLQGNSGAGRGELMVGAVMEKAGGVYADSLGLMAFSYTDFKENLLVQEFFEKNWEENFNENWSNKGPTITFSIGGLQKSTAYIRFGLININNRLVFVLGHETPIIIKDSYQERLELGGVEQKFRPEMDLRIMQAYILNYFGFFGEWKQEPDFQTWEYTNKSLSIIDDENMEALVNLIKVIDTMFETED